MMQDHHACKVKQRQGEEDLQQVNRAVNTAGFKHVFDDFVIKPVKISRKHLWTPVV